MGRIHKEIMEFERSFEIKSNFMMKCDEKLDKLIFLKRRVENESKKSKSRNLNQDLRRNHQVNEIEISKIENREKPKLKLKLT